MEKSETKSNLEMFATPIKAKDHFIKASFGGFAGSGKTRTATELIIGCYKLMQITKPLLIIDNEKGSRFLIPMFEKNGIKVYIKETTQLADILKAFEMLNSGEIGFLFVDSLSKVWYEYTRQYKTSNNKKFLTLQDWGKILPSWQEQFSDKFVELNGNCVFTGRGGNTYEMEENEETHKKEFTKSGVKMKLAGETPFEPDINVWMDLEQELKDGNPVVWRTAQIMKDRSGLIDGMLFKNPTFENFKPVIEFLMNVPVGEVAGQSSTENLSPKESREYWKIKERKENVFSELKTLYEKYAFGASVESKQLKAVINEKVFGFTSGDAISNMPVELLEQGLEMTKIILKNLENYTDHKTKLDYVNKYDLSELNDEVKELTGTFSQDDIFKVPEDTSQPVYTIPEISPQDKKEKKTKK